VLRTTLALAGLLCLPACEQWHLSINADGLVFISVIGDDHHSRDRFRVRTRRSDGVTRVMDVPPSGHLTLRPLTDGVLELTLLTPEGCSVSGPNPRTLDVTAGEAVRVEFDVRCGG
jgi:hypothetical protein